MIFFRISPSITASFRMMLDSGFNLKDSDARVQRNSQSDANCYSPPILDFT